MLSRRDLNVLIDALGDSEAVWEDYGGECAERIMDFLKAVRARTPVYEPIHLVTGNDVADLARFEKALTAIERQTAKYPERSTHGQLGQIAREALRG